MRNLVVFALTCVSLVCAQYAVSDKGFLIKQKNVYELFWHVDQPTVYHPELYQKARSYSIEDNVDSYTNKAAVNEFVSRWKYGMLPRGEVFSVLYPAHYEEAMALFRVFYYAKDFDTFYNTAVWARFNVNEGMYVYVLSIAVLHRPDTKYVRIPPMYEVMPNFFYNTEVIQKGHHIGMGETTAKKSAGGVDLYVVHANYSGWYLNHQEDHEHQINYYTEDIGLNYYYFLSTHEFPFWMNSAEYNFPKGVRGESYYFNHKQLLLRYYFERLSNNMGEIEHLDWHKPIVTGYYPTLTYHNGLPFPERHSGAEIPLEKYEHVKDVMDYETRISAAIDIGYVFDENHKPVDIYTPEGFDILGNIIEGNADSYNYKFYGSLDQLCRKILGFSLEPTTKYQTAPSALEIFSTSCRDPAFYRLYKKIVTYFMRYKAHLPAYTHDELAFPGVKVESVAVDKLMTFFDYFESMISNAVGVHNYKDAQNTIIKARQYRLNHKPFTYHITVNSDKNTKATVRVFLGPKYDLHHYEHDISENYMNFMEVDKWVVELKAGINKIERSSHESIYVVPDEVASDIFYKKTLKAIEGSEAFPYKSPRYGYPDRLMLPKGKKEGMPFKLFVFVSQFDDTHSQKIDSVIWGNVVLDGKSMGYPLDRPVHAYNFSVPNMYFKDVVIYHKDVEELNLTV
ncbi:hexamerin [Orussus abietinus]|uniref:hexamerin n=1 Tax=Orussus abietinus TaxID=222816 RepID=UPI0006264A41|nr:hexamerin [Orussus abietinus]